MADQEWDPTRVKVTTTCPTCGKAFTREMFLAGLIAGVVCEMCPDCTQVDEHGDFVITMSAERYQLRK